MPENLKVYNTLTGEKETFQPKTPHEVKMYVCGPTTYNYIHLGNARPLVVFDTVRRYLEYLGYRVIYIQNFTDVDDKIIKKAQEEMVKPEDLANRYIGEYFQDADALNVKRAVMHPRVSQHMPEIIAFIQGLLDKGYAYEFDGDVYFRVSRFSQYGKLSKRSLEDLLAGARIEVDERKEHPGDFALWKKAKPGEPSWEGPWGRGRPGWHIECSAMSHHYLGENFDIHGGGADLIFPHHENEIAQSEALYDSPMAKYWLHNGFITVNQEKMSKSLGNFFLLRDILKKYDPDTVRYYLLSTHYRSPLDFDDEKLEAAQKGLERLKTAYRLLKEALDKENQADGAPAGEKAGAFREETAIFKKRFEEAMNDDFNTALATAALFDFARAINAFAAASVSQGMTLEERKAAEEGLALYQRLCDVLGLNPEQKKEMGSSDLTESLLQLVLDVRQEAKKKKDFQTADNIRASLRELGIIIEDTPQGARWRYE